MPARRIDPRKTFLIRSTTKLAFDLTINVNPDGVIDTSGSLNIGIFASSYSGKITIVGGNTATTGDHTVGIDANNNRGTIVVTSATISTAGANGNDGAAMPGVWCPMADGPGPVEIHGTMTLDQDAGENLA